jgi:hypothetical protein
MHLSVRHPWRLKPSDQDAGRRYAKTVPHSKM